MTEELCRECGFSSHCHRTPQINSMKSCDLDFRCFPKEQWEEVRSRLKLKKLEAENAALRSRRIADIPDPNSTLLQYIEKLDRGFCSDQPVNLGGVGWPFIRDHVRSLQESFKMQVDISFKLINENASLKQKLEVAKKEIDAIRDGIREHTYPDLELFGEYQGLDEYCRVLLSKLESNGGGE